MNDIPFVTFTSDPVEGERKKWQFRSPPMLAFPGL